MKSESIDLLSPVWTHLTQIQPVRGDGIYLYDEQDNRYMDFTCGIGVTNTGHCHPKVVKAIQEQAEKLIFGQMNIVIPPVSIALAEALKEIMPASIDSFFFSNSGAEAVEASVKLARHATGKRNIVVFHGSFHGRTAQTMAMTTSKYIYRYNYQPLPGGVFVAPYPNQHYYQWTEDETVDYCLRELDRLFHSQTLTEETAAIIIEPVLGEGGYVPAPAKFLRELADFCRANHILLITDEVQCGFGRTGKFFAFEHAAIEPDIVVMAKGLGSGLPISAIAAPRALMEKWVPGTHGGTYGGGSAVALASALATVQVLQSEGLIENSAERGMQLIDGLKQLKDQFSLIQDVRGLGLMIGTEFYDKDTTLAIQQACIKQKLILLTCGTYENVIRWVPPLIVSKEQVKEALRIFERAVSKVN